jgi:glycosyltransferase involved in cell wall biosynthesis
MSSHLRVAHVVGPYVPVPPVKYGGTEQVISALITGLLENNHEPILFGSGDSRVNCELVPISETAISFAKSKEAKPAHDILVAQSLDLTYQKLKEMHLQNPFDIVHIHDPLFIDPLQLDYLPVVLTQHSIINVDELTYFQERKDCNYVAISNNLQEASPFLNYVGVVYNGLNPDQFAFTAEAEDYVCFIGRFDHEKNPHLAIEIALSLGIPIKLAGKIDFKGEKYFEEFIRPHLSNPLVEYLGELTFIDKIKLVSKSKCNIHPISFREPFGLTVLEAAYCGTPTLAFHRGSMPELIEQGRTGLVVEDVIEACSRLEECFSMHRDYISTRAKALFHYTHMTNEYLEVYAKVIAEFSSSKQ